MKAIFTIIRTLVLKYAVVGGLIVYSLFSSYLYFNQVKKGHRLLTDLKAADQTAEQFRAKNGQLASKLIAQELTTHELKQVHPDVVRQLRNLYIPPQRAESYSKTSQQMKAEVLAQVTPGHQQPDTAQTRYKMAGPGPVEGKIRMLQYSDKWISIKTGNLDLTPVKVQVLANDTIFTAIYRGKRRHPWAWIFSRRQLTTAATNRNPYIRIKVVSSGVVK